MLRELRALGERRNVEGMARFGIHAKLAYGVAKPKMDALARKIGRDHRLALALWNSRVHDARILAGMIAEPERVTPRQMDRWARDFDSWDVCDGTCCHLFVFAQPAWRKAIEWSRRKEEFIKRAGFALMAYLAYRDRTAPDAKFLRLLTIIRREANDERNFVKKAVNWALRNIGKRNPRLNRAAIRAAEAIRRTHSPAARRKGSRVPNGAPESPARRARGISQASPGKWVAADALRELRSEAVQRRLRKGSCGALALNLSSLQFLASSQ